MSDDDWEKMRQGPIVPWKNKAAREAQVLIESMRESPPSKEEALEIIAACNVARTRREEPPEGVCLVAQNLIRTHRLGIYCDGDLPPMVDEIGGQAGEPVVSAMLSALRGLRLELVACDGCWRLEEILFGPRMVGRFWDFAGPRVHPAHPCPRCLVLCQALAGLIAAGEEHNRKEGEMTAADHEARKKAAKHARAAGVEEAIEDPAGKIAEALLSQPDMVELGQLKRGGGRRFVRRLPSAMRAAKDSLPFNYTDCDAGWVGSSPVGKVRFVESPRSASVDSIWRKFRKRVSEQE